MVGSAFSRSCFLCLCSSFQGRIDMLYVGDAGCTNKAFDVPGVVQAGSDF